MVESIMRKIKVIKGLCDFFEGLKGCYRNFYFEIVNKIIKRQNKVKDMYVFVFKDRGIQRLELKKSFILKRFVSVKKSFWMG